MYLNLTHAFQEAENSAVQGVGFATQTLLYYYKPNTVTPRIIKFIC